MFKIQYQTVQGWKEGEREYKNALDAMNHHKRGLNVFSARVVYNGQPLFDMSPDGQVIRVHAEKEPT